MGIKHLDEEEGGCLLIVCHGCFVGLVLKCFQSSKLIQHSGCVCGAVRLVSTTKALGADDITFNVGPIGLWSLGEITSGYLVLCIPSAPKAFKGSILGHTIARFAERFSRSSAPSNSRHGLPSWYRPNAPRRPQRSEFSEITKFEVTVTKPPSVMRFETMPQDEQGSHGSDVVWGIAK